MKVTYLKEMPAGAKRSSRNAWVPIIEKFHASDVPVMQIDVSNDGYKTAQGAQTSIKKVIRKSGYLMATTRKGNLVFVYKINPDGTPI